MFFWNSLFYDPTDVGSLNSGSSAFSKSSLYLWGWEWAWKARLPALPHGPQQPGCQTVERMRAWQEDPPQGLECCCRSMLPLQKLLWCGFFWQRWSFKKEEIGIYFLPRIWRYKQCPFFSSKEHITASKDLNQWKRTIWKYYGLNWTHRS